MRLEAALAASRAGLARASTRSIGRVVLFDSCRGASVEDRKLGDI